MVIKIKEWHIEIKEKKMSIRVVTLILCVSSVSVAPGWPVAVVCEESNKFFP